VSRLIKKVHKKKKREEYLCGDPMTFRNNEKLGKKIRLKNSTDSGHSGNEVNHLGD